MNCITPEKECIGCSACYTICPEKAISMIQDAKGFYTAFIDSIKCIDCGLCKKQCPLH